MLRSPEDYKPPPSQNANKSKAKINRHFFAVFHFYERDKCQRNQVYFRQITYKFSPGSPHVSKGSAQPPILTQLVSKIMRITHNDVTRPYQTVTGLLNH